MKGEWKRMAKNGQRAWDHIAAEHNQLPENVTMRAVFLRLVSPIGGLEAYCAHRLRESYPQNTDKLRDVSNEVCLFFRDVPKSMPAFKVTFMGSSPAYRGWLIVEPFTKDWFELRNGRARSLDCGRDEHHRWCRQAEQVRQPRKCDT